MEEATVQGTLELAGGRLSPSARTAGRDRRLSGVRRQRNQRPADELQNIRRRSVQTGEAQQRFEKGKATEKRRQRDETRATAT